MTPAWRWFGPADPVSLPEVRQAGAIEVVTALHERRCGEPWTAGEIAARKSVIEGGADSPTGLRWSIVESVPVHEAIKTGTPDAERYLDHYRATLRELGRQGVRVVCYNFMPVTDWTRTALALELPDGSRVSGWSGAVLSALERHVLGLRDVESRYTAAEISAGDSEWAALGESGRAACTRVVLMGLPGTVDDLTPAEFRRELDRYRDIGPDGLRAALVNFLHAVLPAAREAGITLAIHPDDPPRPLFGLPRVASTAADLEALFDAVPDSQNGLTFCSGSLGGRLDNDPVAIFRRFADRIPFAHFRNVECLSAERGAFRETGHLDGRVDMAALMAALVDEEARRRGAGREDWSIPVRPDHGRELIRDQGRGHYPGYPYEGRMVALAELRGLEAGIRHAVDRLRQPAGGSAKDAPAGRHRD